MLPTSDVSLTAVHRAAWRKSWKTNGVRQLGHAGPLNGMRWGRGLIAESVWWLAHLNAHTCNGCDVVSRSLVGICFSHACCYVLRLMASNERAFEVWVCGAGCITRICVLGVVGNTAVLAWFWVHWPHWPHWVHWPHWPHWPHCLICLMLPSITLGVYEYRTNSFNNI